MSVILGIVEGNEVIIAGDKRGSTKNGELISDDIEKVILVNDHLAFAVAGNHSIEVAIKIDIEKAKNREIMTTEDLLNIVTYFYKRVINENIQFILNLPFVILIAGKNNKGIVELRRIQCIRGNFDSKIVPMAIISPADVQQATCDIFFARNYSKNKETFAEMTIKDIANISELVSITGSKWVYSSRTDKGELFRF